MFKRAQSTHRSPVAKVAGVIDIQGCQQLGVTVKREKRGGDNER